MEREIEFRGRTKDGVWRYGNLVQFNGMCSIVSNKTVEETPLDYVGAEIIKGVVDAETVGQFTGCKDKNVVKIYGGDIVKDCNDHMYLIEWCEERHAFCMTSLPIITGNYSWSEPLYNLDLCEIVGNKWENPELMELE